MPPTPLTQRGIDPAATTPMSRVAATLDLSAPTVAWLATPHDQALTGPQKLT